MIELPTELQLSAEFLKQNSEYKNLPNAELEKIAGQLVSIGENVALQFQNADVLEEARIRGIRVEMRNGGVVAGKLIRGFYDHSIKTLATYTDGIQSVLNTSAPEVLGVERTVEAIREVLMWHEFFHVLEFTELGLVGKQFKIPKKVLFFTTHKPVYAVSEVCANAFCKTVMNLNHSPFIIDHLYHQETKNNPTILEAEKE